MMAVVGWLVFCIISAVLGGIGFFFLVLAAKLNDMSCFIMTVIFWLLSAGFGWAAYCHAPFKVVLL
jgi:hypothetical protein